MHVSGDRTIDRAGQGAVVRSVGGAWLLGLWKGGLGWVGRKGKRKGLGGRRTWWERNEDVDAMIKVGCLVPGQH